MILATWNLARAQSPVQRARMLPHIAGVPADVWVFTETHDLLDSGYRYTHSSAAGRDGDSDRQERWVTLAAHHPLAALSVGDPARTAAARVLPAAGKPFLVIGTVLPWLGSGWRGIPALEGAAFQAALDLQLADWLRLRADFPDDDLFLLGDFNQDLADSHYYGSRRNRTALEAALSAAGLVALTAGDNDPVRRDAPPLACIDHICGPAHAARRLLRTFRWPQLPRPDGRLSDHFGIAVELTP